MYNRQCEQVMGESASILLCMAYLFIRFLSLRLKSHFRPPVVFQANPLITNYVESKTQCVIGAREGEESTIWPVLSGVSQGSVHGQLLFSSYQLCHRMC